MQWGAFAALIGTLMFQVKQRDKDRDALTEWRTNIKRDVDEVKNQLDHEVQVITERLDRHERHGSRLFDRLFDRLGGIANDVKDVSERLVRIESHMNGG